MITPTVLRSRSRFGDGFERLVLGLVASILRGNILKSGKRLHSRIWAACIKSAHTRNTNSGCGHARGAPLNTNKHAIPTGKRHFARFTHNVQLS